MTDRQPGGARTHPWRPFAVTMGSLALFFGAVARLYFRQYHLPFRSEAALYLCLLLLLGCAVAPASSVTRDLIQRAWEGWAGIPMLVGSWLLPYLIYAWGCSDFRWAAVSRLLAIAVPALVIYRAAPVRKPTAFCWQDACAWTWLVLAVVVRQTNGIWNIPANLDFMARLFMIATTSWYWVFVRPVPGFGYSFSVSMRTARAAAVNFVSFAVIAIPASYGMHFAAWNPRWHGIAAFLTAYLEIFVFIAWLEELFFRGVLQTLLSGSGESPVRGQLLASAAFGLSHVLLAPAPNWRYIILATLAGWFYGSAFRQSGNLMGSSLAHALVDTAWRTWFGRG